MDDSHPEPADLTFAEQVAEAALSQADNDPRFALLVAAHIAAFYAEGASRGYLRQPPPPAPKKYRP